MDAYIGIDIGTTNSKCMIATTDGIVSVVAEPTPKCVKYGHVFFDIQRISEMVDFFICKASSGYKVKSIGFSSIGESVVPVLKGQAISDALMWDEKIPETDTKKIEILRTLCPYNIVGTKDNGLFSIHKILWMIREGLSDGAEGFLPVSSYLAYRKTGVSSWDFSQASRSFMFSVRNREWIPDLLETFGISQMPAIKPMGSFVGEKDGIVYGLGGHDHIVGMFGIERVFGRLFPGKSLFYTSMGTSEVMALRINKDSAIKNLCNSENGCIIPSNNNDFIITRSFRMFGRFLSRLMEMFRLPDFSSLPSSINGIIRCLFCCDGDFVMGNRGTGEINILGLPNGCSCTDVMEAAYVYLATVSELLRESIAKDTGTEKDFIIAAGGGITRNDCFMRVLSSAFSSPISMLDTSEISAFGAMLVGLSALQDKKAEESVLDTIGYTSVPVDSQLDVTISDAMSRYRLLRNKMFKIN